MGVGGGVLGTLASAALFLFPEQCEPLVRLVGPLLLPRSVRAEFDYDDGGYYFFAAMAVVMTVIWIGITLIAGLKKPKEDARIDAKVRARDREKARGAFIDPL